MTYIDPQHGGVTDDELEAYVRSRLGQDTPLAPVVQGQQRTTPQFQAGQGGAQPQSVDETGGGQQPPELYVPAASDDDEEGGEDDEVELEESEPQQEVPPQEEGGPPEPSEPQPPAQPEPTPEGYVRVGDQVLPLQQVQALLQFEQLLVQDAELRSAIEAHLRRRGEGAAGAPTPTPAAPAVEIPEEYRDDPVYQAVTSRIEQQQQLLDDQQRQLASMTDIVQRQQAEETQARFARVSARFRDDHQITDEQLSDLGNVAARLNVMEPLVRGTDPLTGEPAPRDPDQWIYRALEIAYWSVPEYRDKEYSKKVQQRAKDQQRKQRLAGVGGSSGSVPRVTPIPTEPHERLAAARREMAEMMGRSEEQ